MLGLRICISKKLPRSQVMPMLLFQIPHLDHLTHFKPSPLSLTLPYPFSPPSLSADNHSSYFSGIQKSPGLMSLNFTPPPSVSTSLPSSAIVEEVPLLSEANSSSYVLTLSSLSCLSQIFLSFFVVLLSSACLLSNSIHPSILLSSLLIYFYQHINML